MTKLEQQYKEFKIKEAGQVNQQINLKENYNIFSLSVRNCLLTEALNFLLEDTLPEGSKQYAKSICENYVQEQKNVQSLLNRMSRTSHMLSEMNIAITESYNSIMDKVNKEDELSFIINPRDMESFYDKMKNLKDENVTKAITTKVCNAAEKYVQDNIKVKAELDKIANRTIEKIDTINARSEASKAALEQAYIREEKAAIAKVHDSRTVSLYENIVRRVYKNVLKDQSIQENFSDESGAISIEKIEGMSNAIYSFLEMLNTCRIESVDKDFVYESLMSL